MKIIMKLQKLTNLKTSNFYDPLKNHQNLLNDFGKSVLTLFQ